jgi:RNA polymerase sigma-70 factor (ECF subfamily)
MEYLLNSKRSFMWRANLLKEYADRRMASQEQQHLAALIAAVQRHEPLAFDSLYARYAHALHRYIYARCGDAALAEELLGDVWLFVVERLPEFRLPAQGADLAFSSWLYRIARLRVLDYYRRSKRQPTPLEEHVPSEAPAMDEAIEQSEERAALHNALANLPPDQREVVLLRYFERRTSADVAALMDRSEGAVKALQHRAIAALARALNGKQAGA